MDFVKPAKWIYKAVRLLVIVAILSAVVGSALLYIGVSLPSTQSWLRKVGEKELSTLLGAQVKIGEVSLMPFNRVALSDVAVITAPSDTALRVEWLGAGVNMTKLLTSRKIVISYAELIGLDAKVHRDSAGAPLNIQPIIEALKPKDKNKPPTLYDLRINTVIIRKSSLSYDVGYDLPQEGKFDPDHIKVSSFRADLRIPRIKNDNYEFDLRRIAFEERSGFELDNLSGDFVITSNGSRVRDFVLNLPASEIRLDDVALNYLSWEGLKRDLPRLPISVSTMTGSYLTLSDLSSFVPLLARFDSPANLDISVSGCIDSMTVHRAGLINSSDGWWARIEEVAVDSIMSNPAAATIDASKISVGFPGKDIDWIAGLTGKISEQARSILRNASDIRLDASFKGSPKAARITASVSCAPGTIDIDGLYQLEGSKGKYFSSGVSAKDFDLGLLFSGQKAALSNFGKVSLEAKGEVAMTGTKHITFGNLAVDLPVVEYKGHTYTGVTADINKEEEEVRATFMLSNTDVKVGMGCEMTLSDESPQMELDIDLQSVNLAQLNIISKFPGHTLSARGHGILSGKNVDNINGNIWLRDIRFVDDNDQGVKIRNIALVAQSDRWPKTITLDSDFADGILSGSFHWATLPKVLRNMASAYFPALVTPVEINRRDGYEFNDFDFKLSLKSTSPFENVVKFPVSVVSPVSLSGEINESHMTGRLNLDAPYLVQKDKVIENTSLDLGLGRSPVSLILSTRYPTKQGPLDFSLKSVGMNDRVNTGIEWKVERERDYRGEINIVTDFKRVAETDDTDGFNIYNDKTVTGGERKANREPADNQRKPLLTMVSIESGEAVFNDTVWTISCPLISVAKNRVAVDSLMVSNLPQYLTIDGIASKDETDSLTIDLRDMNLDYIFETLNISNVMFGGRASGLFHGSRLLSGSPSLYTPKLHVDNLCYNHSLLGNADISSYWEDSRKAVVINAEIDQPNGCRSRIDGRIMPMADSLDFHFDAGKIRVGFMKPYMEAFAEDVDGYASGTARLWGSFKFIDMVGDIYAQDVSLKLGFTGCTYWATDSVHLAPGRINLENVKLRDMYNHTAVLNGWVTHKCFKEPQFNFRVDDARELLMYDMKKDIEYPWWGTVFGNGSANISSSPDNIKIDVHMSTAPRTTFFFEISDRESANDYNFITFRDRDQAKKDSIKAFDPTPLIIRQLRERQSQTQNNGPSTPYVMNFSVDVTPLALMTLIMDPDGGDNIKARGSGHMDFYYNSGKDDMSLTGVYTLDEGSYNFTFQDIIIKDFTIQKGSRISFTGDPYNANLDIHAAYDLTANLSDLDESFLQEKEINSPNVRVRAMLDVLGNMQRPDFSFDIQLPGLSDAIQNKLRSIVNTEDMMNRQVFYLVAFNRFYTPEYMSASRGNELVSLASSTLSSQLGNMLGQLSDKFSIAPNVRSDRGDFSDVEVDVALSSQLLNNRLILNGNFGYRDKALNTNSFVGDFDIEYILNKSGNLRLKAYNRYNDQNYYMRNALTTQGVGVVIRRDFDSMFSFLRPLRRKFWSKKSDKSSDKPDKDESKKNNKEDAAVKTDSIPEGKSADKVR